MTDFSDLTSGIREAVDSEIDANLRLLTDQERLYWISTVDRRLVNAFVHLYERAKLINQVLEKHGYPPSTRLLSWSDTQLMLRSSVDGKYRKDLIETMKIRNERILDEASAMSPPAPVPPATRKRRLGFR